QFREAERIGPFTATFSSGTANPYLSYAVPDDGAEPSAEDVAALVAAYRERGLVPRLEYVPALAPAVEPALLEAGFTVELRAPLMALGEARAPEPPPGIELVEAVTEPDVRATATAQHEAYAEPGPPSNAWVEGMLRGVAAGGLVVLARDTGTGEPAGGGQCTPPAEGATELAAIGVRPAYRRRGIAAAMTAWLAERMRARGASLVWLTAAGEPEARIYAGVGFERVGDALYISLRDEP
ncbi:MAG: GNAT family N-acetyltransferase, partial [Actinobacteria bacterium]|nr:GNAT family N-acetyltransferase [Actinomycetota bacterium]